MAALYLAEAVVAEEPSEVATRSWLSPLREAVEGQEQEQVPVRLGLLCP
jgi:hypothetical protein